MGLTDCTTNQNTTVKWKMRYIRRLCCLLPLAGCAKLCMMQSVLCTHTLLCHRHPALGTGTQPLALEVFKTQHKPLTFLLLACLPLFFFPSLTFSVPHSWCASFAICWRSQRVLCAFPLALAMNEPCACWALQWCQSWARGCCLPSLPSFVPVPSCTPAVQGSDLLITPASSQNKHCFKRSLCLTFFPASENFISSTLSSDEYLPVIWKKGRALYELWLSLYKAYSDWELPKATNLG